jgi:hypothetical protein
MNNFNDFGGAEPRVNDPSKSRQIGVNDGGALTIR